MYKRKCKHNRTINIDSTQLYIIAMEYTFTQGYDLNVIL